MEMVEVTKEIVDPLKDAINSSKEMDEETRAKVNPENSAVKPIKQKDEEIKETMDQVNGKVHPVKETDEEIKETIDPVNGTFHQVKEMDGEIKETIDPVNGTVHPLKETDEEIKETIDPVNGTVHPLKETDEEIKETIDPVNGTFHQVKEMDREIKETIDPVNGTVHPLKETDEEIKETIDPVNGTFHQVKETDKEIKETMDPVNGTVHPLKETDEEIKDNVDLEKCTLEEDNQPPDERVAIWKRNLKIGFVFLLSVYDGIVESSYGPTVADYQCIYDETQQRTSLLYPVFITLKAVGTVAFLLFRNQVDPYIVGVVCMVVGCVLLVSLPLLPALWLALALTGLIGLAAGISSHARLVESGQLGKTSAVPLHLFPLGLCTGSFIAPLIISPFLGVSDTWRRNETSDNPSMQVNISFNTSYANKTMFGTEVMRCENFSSGILYSFLIFLCGAFALVITYIFFRNTLKSDIKRGDSNTDGGKARVTLLDIVFLTLLGFLVIIGAPSNFIFGNLLSTFGIHSRLKISPNIMALMTSSFFGATVIGRIVGTFISLVLKQITLQVVCLLGSVGAAIALVFVAEISTASLWSITSTFAFVYAPLFGAVIAWSTEISNAKHILYGLIIVADLAGSSLMAFLIGQLMNNVHNDWLIYCMLGVCVLQVGVLFVMFVVSKFMDGKKLVGTEL